MPPRFTFSSRSRLNGQNTASEKIIQDAILQYLWGIGYPAYAVPNRGLYNIKTGTYNKKESGQIKGVPDIICPCFKGITVYFEVKTPAGIVEDDQKLYHEKLTSMGHKVAVVRCVDQVRQWLSLWGLSRERPRVIPPEQR